MLTLEIIIPIAVLIAGILILTISSDKAVKHSIHLASAIRVSPFIIGLVLVSIGTDLPEIANSINSSWNGHGDINLGDSIGSVLVQITFVLGIIGILSKSFKIKRKDVSAAGLFLVLSLILSVYMVVTGFTEWITIYITTTHFYLFTKGRYRE